MQFVCDAHIFLFTKDAWAKFESSLLLLENGSFAIVPKLEHEELTPN